MGAAYILNNKQLLDETEHDIKNYPDTRSMLSAEAEQLPDIEN